ncbi:MAG TPA: AI-2E family transporter YdiK [Vicinamibacterales bacterium]|jgi:predicted PurR-regulated permease PerM|nr:AI-2E family transporter YdiK [Vicinamibacterales bacterium]
MQTTGQTDLTRIVLVILIIAVLITGSLWTLLPFLGALIWAATIVVATWPLLLRVQEWMHGRRAPATAVMTLVMLATFIVPSALAVTILLDSAIKAADLVQAVSARGIGSPPAWLDGIPWVGARLTTRWQTLAAGGPEAIVELLRPFARETAGLALSMTGGLGSVIVHFLLTVILATILYTNGEAAARGMMMFAHRIGKEHGRNTIRLAGQAVRGVALGVIVTALVESIIAGVGLWLTGMPRPGLLLALTFILCVAQLGPLPVLLPAVIWLFWSGSSLWGSVLLAFTILVAVVDNVLKPVLIRRGVDLPLILIVAGVIGGIVGFGVLGLFIGPVILAVTYTLLQSWILEDQPAPQ